MLFLREFPWAFLPLPRVVANMAVALTGDCAIQRKTEVPTVYVPCGRPRCHHFRFLTFIFCVLVLSLHVYLCIICVECLLEARGGSLRTGILGGCELPCLGWESSLGPLEEHPLLAPEPSLRFSLSHVKRGSLQRCGD